MLLSLAIDNLAVVEHLVLMPGHALNVLSGETGAGKSVVLGALGLALGGRASSDLVRAGAISAAVEARFSIDGLPTLGPLLTEEGLATGDELVLRRTLHLRGGSRCEVNGRPVRLAVLRRIGALLVDLVGQHAQHSLLDPGTHRDLLDRFSGLASASMADAWQALSDALRRQAILVDRASTATDRAEWLRHQLAELAALQLEEGEVAQVAAEVALLSHANEIADRCGHANALLYERDGSVVEALVESESALGSLADVDSRFGELAAMLAEARVLVEEVVRDAAGHADIAAEDPIRLDQLQARLEDVRRLGRKHGVAGDDLWAVSVRLAAELDSLDDLEQQLGRAAVAVSQAEVAARVAADTLHRSRVEGARRLQLLLAKELADLELPRARFAVTVTVEPDSLGPAGWDQVAFELSANPGEPMRCLSRVASGGELSRVLMALTVALQDAQATPTVVLDEVDAGLSGAAAQAVAVKLGQLAAGRQVLCVTHLPVIAAVGDEHFAVCKQDDGERTLVLVDALDGRGRVDEIARMVGGRTVTERTRALARELLGDRASERGLRVVG